MTEHEERHTDNFMRDFGDLLRRYIEMRKKVIEENYGLDSSYKIICDETNNTPEDAENGVVNVDIIITPHKTIDEIYLSLVKKDD
jgi:hypothetical protein